jgi:type I restriction enzyme S subunit
MTVAVQTYKLSDLLCRSDEVSSPLSDAVYKEITVRLWGKGVIERGQVSGSSVNGRRFVARANQFIMSRIDARNGALGIVPQSLDGALVTNDFPLFNLNSDLILSGYLDLHCKTPQFVNLCSKASEGTTNRVRLKEAEFLRSEIDLPSLENQKKIVSQLDTIKGKLQAASALQEGIDKDVEKLLAERFQATLNGAAWRSMREVAPLVKRQVDLEPNRLYKELGARSFGKGLFIKPDFDSATATWEKPVWIKAGDLVFSNIKAWEGAIGVALPEHDGYIASHRYLTAVAKPEFILADYLLHFLLTEQGLLAVNEASPGTADRNRTTKKSVLEMIQVPVPPIAVQRHFIALKNKLVQAAIERTKQKTLTEALIPSMLSKLLTT